VLTGNVLLDGFSARVDQEPDAVAAVDCATGEELTCRLLEERAVVAARQLEELGVGCGDHVITTVPLGIDFLAYCLGAFKLGAVPALVNPNVEPAALRQCLNELAAPAWISGEPDPSQLPSQVIRRQLASSFADAPRPRVASDTVLMLYTSGTTGAPKGVPWTSRELASQIAVYRDPAITSEFCLFPHLALIAVAMGRTAVLPALSTVAPATVDIEMLHRQLMEFGGDYVFGSPLLWQRLADYLALGHRPPPVRKAATAGSAVNSRLLEQLSKVMPGTEFSVPYASTEVLMPITLITAADYIYHSGFGTWAGRGVPLGHPAAEMRIGIIDSTMNSNMFDSTQMLEAEQIGEIVVAGPRVTETYYERPDVENHAKMHDPHDGTVWHRTADIGYVDRRGQLWYLCRKKDVVRRGKLTYYPDAIEAMLNMVTGAALSAVVFDDDVMFYVMAAADAPDVVDTGSLAILCQRCDLPPPRTIRLPSALPADSRHNSKINREATLAQVRAFLTSKSEMEQRQ
jgi:acyl-CoA synthetase (AMP-forming)/AMP-acid ligase II